MKVGNHLAAICGAIGLVACSPKDNPLKWTENVFTPDGQVVPLKRIQYFDKGDFVGQHSFEFRHPKTGESVKWESDPFINFSLVALFFAGDKAHILVAPRFGIDSERAGCPYPSAFIFRWIDGKWEQIAYKDSPLAEIRNNATVDPKADRERIQQSGYQLAAGAVRQFEQRSDGHSPGLTLSKFPDQVFQCPTQQKVKFK